MNYRLQRYSSAKRYSIEMESNNHATLHLDIPRHASAVDLGEVPRNFTTIEQLRGYLEMRIRRLPEFNVLFDRPGGQRYSILLFERILMAIWSQNLA